MSPRKGKQTQEWFDFCKENYGVTPDDVSDAHQLANHPEMKETLSTKRIKFLRARILGFNNV